jgi:hypothetical protein
MKTSRLILALVLPLAACTVGGTGDDMNPPPGDDTAPTTLAGSVSTDTMVSGPVTLLNDTTVEAGVTLTIAAGTVLDAQTAKKISVKGTLLIQGVAGQEVQIAPATGGAWAGFVVETGGSADIAYVTGHDVANFLYSKSGSTATIDHVTMTNAGKATQVEGMVTITKSSFQGNTGINVLTTGNISATDSTFQGTSGDTIVQTGGTLVLDHIAVGSSSTGNDHCAMHINAGSDVTVSYSNIMDTTVGLMIGGTDGASYSYNNFSNLTNLEDISSDTLNSNGTFDHNYITGTVPNIPGITFTNPEAAMIPGTGPRP